MTPRSVIALILGAKAGRARASCAAPAVAWPFKTYEMALESLAKVRQHIQAGAFEQAEADLADARAGLGDDSKVLIASGEIANARGLWPEAQRRWQMVIDRDPDAVLAYAHRALAVRQQGDVSRAAALYAELIRRFPADVGAPIAMVHLVEHLDAADRAKYLKIAEAGIVSLIGRHPGYAILFVTHARIARMQGDLQTAYTRLCQAKELNRSDSSIWKEIKDVVQVLEERRKAGTASLFQARMRSEQ